MQKFDRREENMTNHILLSEIGLRIKELRTLKGMTQSELAILCNFEKASMSRIESGKTNVSVLTLLKISNALEVRISELFKD